MNDSIGPEILTRWLEKLAVARLELKVQRFEERLTELALEQRFTLNEPPPRYDEIPFGLNPDELPSPIPTLAQHELTRVSFWEQLLYEGIMEALGYSKNQQPFLRLAQCLRLDVLKEFSGSVSSLDASDLEAILFNTAGLLPSLKDITGRESKVFVHSLKHAWKNVRTYYHGPILSSADWQFFRLRPENFPTIRLAGAARMMIKLLQGGFFKSIVHAVKDEASSPRDRYCKLEEQFIVPAGGFWLTHYSFHDRSSTQVHTLIGKSRAKEIMLNVIIPLCLLYARMFKIREMREYALVLYNACPPSSPNTITRTIDTQLIKGRLPRSSAMIQQGSLQLYKFFCVEERCTECAVGKTVFH